MPDREPVGQNPVGISMNESVGVPAQRGPIPHRSPEPPPITQDVPTTTTSGHGTRNKLIGLGTLGTAGATLVAAMSGVFGGRTQPQPSESLVPSGGIVEPSPTGGMPSATATLPEGTAWPSETPSPVTTTSPSPEVSPTITPAEGWTPEQIQKAQDFLDRKGVTTQRFTVDGNPVRLGLAPNTELQGGSQHWWTGVIVEFKPGEYISDSNFKNGHLLLGFQDAQGKNWFRDVITPPGGIFYETTDFTDVGHNDGNFKFLTYPQFAERFDSEFRGQLTEFFAPFDQGAFLSFYNAGVIAQSGSIQDAMREDPYINQLNPPKSPAVGLLIMPKNSADSN